MPCNPLDDPVALVALGAAFGAPVRYASGFCTPGSVPAGAGVAGGPRLQGGNPERFQARIDATARTLRGNPRYKNVSPKYLQGLVEFVSGNMLFVLLHELAHAAITQMGLPVLGRMEDAADTFAAQKP